ncbi:hydantoinase/oxoprolinase N-terminal domain-containing protein [Sciscionella sediminilitoris]|uniref:hydantoinase/oxoprolinase N-terminal domain-containing protein n=1 Tax=Sciscionella sediminilitoris TaxID=1445613 RepID=UPI00069053C7|nr:hydantoinase/oxoprolinase N-terminal domain-containing protein [Sciscionella sp. SE31]
MIGVDIGVRETTAVLDGTTVRVPSTADVYGGVRTALDRLGASGPVVYGLHNLGRAVLCRTGLARVAVLRIGGGAVDAVRPLYDWPEPLRAAVHADSTIVDGGVERSGRAIAPLDRAATIAFAERNRGAAFAICGPFGPLHDEQERDAAELVRAAAGTEHVSCSADIGSLGLRGRENACVLDAALRPLAARLAERLAAPDAYFLCGDGSCCALDLLAERPSSALGSAHAALLRGAAELRGRTELLVVLEDAVGAVAGELLVESSAARFAGVPVSLPIAETLTATDAEGLAEALDRLAPVPGQTPVQRIGELDADPAVVRAVGAAAAPVVGRSVRVDDSGEAAEPAARADAIRRGAEPADVRTVSAWRHRLPYLHAAGIRSIAVAAGPAVHHGKGAADGG